MKRIIGAISALALAATLAGCSEYDGEPDPKTGANSELEVRHIKVDSRTVTCIIYHADYKGGVSCDWAGATR